MKRMYSLVLLFVLACVSASPARAAWTPNLPGWTVHEVPVNIPFVGFFPNAITLDPLTGDVFLVGYDAPGGGNVFLYRVSQTGDVQNLAPSEGGPPVFDPVHRIVLLPDGYEIRRFTETGVPLPPIVPWAQGAIAIAPNGDLYALVGGGASAPYLQIRRYDPALNEWPLVRDVPPQTESYPPLYDNSPLSQFQIDAAGRMFVSPDGSSLFRIDETESVLIGATLLRGGIAAGADRVLLGLAGYDPEATTLYSPQYFATPTTGHATFGVVAAPGGDVIYLAAARHDDGTISYWLEIFTLGPTPAVQRSWGALKSLGH